VRSVLRPCLVELGSLSLLASPWFSLPPSPSPPLPHSLPLSRQGSKSRSRPLATPKPSPALRPASITRIGWQSESGSSTQCACRVAAPGHRALRRARAPAARRCEGRALQAEPWTETSWSRGSKSRAGAPCVCPPGPPPPHTLTRPAPLSKKHTRIGGEQRRGGWGGGAHAATRESSAPRSRGGAG